MPLDVGILLFNRGAGGNFLSRPLTLDPKTVCLSKKNINTVEERVKFYHYNNIQFPSTEFSAPAEDGLSKWVSHELFEMYFPFSRGFENLLELNLKIIEPMHPNHLSDKLNLLGPDDVVKIAIIENDCLDWTYQQAVHKIDKNISRQSFNELEKTENSIINDYRKKYSCCSIKLSDIIGTDMSFLDSYHKLCNFFGVNFYDQYALEIRNSWKKTWASVE